MKIKPLKSSSAGNCIILECEGDTILLDAGLPYMEIAQEVFFSDVDFTLITHLHNDHFHAVPELIRRGNNVVMSEGTAQGKFDGRYVRAQHNKPLFIKNWRVLPFNVKHDVPEPLGFLIEHIPTSTRIVYAVDTGQLWFKFKNVNYYLVEANHCEIGLQKMDVDEVVKKRIAGNHLSIQKLENYFKECDLSHTDEIWLLHLSSGNSNAKQFIKRIESLTGIPTYVA